MDYVMWSFLAWFAIVVVWNMWEFFSGSEVL